jgi:serine/threonine-protein kinase HipA
MRKAKIFSKNQFAGYLVETLEGEYTFEYDVSYLQDETTLPISLTLPKRKEIYRSKILFPFFDGIIPEGWLLDIGLKNWKLDSRDRMGLLLHLCEEAIGSISVKAEDEND